MDDLFSAGYDTVFDYAGKQWMITRVPARKAWHIIRRVAPLLKSLSSLANMDKDTITLLNNEGDNDPAKTAGKMQKLLTLIGPIADSLGELPDETMDYLINSCLSHVRVETAKGMWTVIYNPNANAFQYEISPLDMMTLTARVLMVVLPDFLGGSAPRTTPPGDLPD
jgi:hypothetical protein